MKRAELPNGKILEFPDETPERVVLRTARKELGISELDIIADKLDGLSKAPLKLEDGTLDPLSKANRALARSMQDMSRELTMQTAQMANAMHDIAKSMSKSVAGSHFETQLHVDKSVAALVTAAGKIDTVVEKLEAVIERTARTSAAIVESHNKMALALEQGLDGSLEKFALATAKITETLSGLRRDAMQSKRAYRRSDGSWVLEPLRPDA